MILMLPVCAFLVDYSLAFSQNRWGVKEFGKCPPQETRFQMTDICLCPDWKVCDVITAACSIEECDLYASMQQLANGSGVVYGNMNAMDSKTRLRCNHNFHHEKDEYWMVCLATGQWSSNIKCKANTNVAVGKPAEQSSNYFISTASSGVDGNTTQQVSFPGTCFHTQSEVNPWWRVNLESLFYVTYFVLYNRVDDYCHECRARAHDIEVKFGQTLDTLTLIDFLPGVLPNIYRKQLGFEALTRYAQVSIKSTDTQNGDVLHLCEVELYGYACKG